MTRGEVETFAFDAIFLGEADRVGGAPSTTAWRFYGYDLDGLRTDHDAGNVCGLANGAPRSNQIDGNQGIDNAAGAILLPILETFESVPRPSDTETEAIRSGAWTIELQLDGFSNASNVEGIGARVFTCGSFDQGTPAFDNSTDWPVLASSVVDGASTGSGARVQFENAYVTADGTFVSGVPSDRAIVIPLTFANSPKWPLMLSIHHAVITFARDSVDPTRLVNGTIAGVLETDEFIEAVRTHAHQNKSLCDTAFLGVADQVDQAQDILRDGTNASSLPCDAISIGIGFTARLVANPTKVVPDAPVPPDPCDAGANGDASGE